MSGVDEIMNIERNQENKDRLTCDICQKTFGRNSELNRHLKIHSAEKPFKCDVCEKAFSRNDDLTRHLKIHLKEKSLICEICNVTFSRRDSHIAHMRRHNDPQYTCRDCNKKFASKFNMMQHMRTQHTSNMSFVSVKKRKVTSKVSRPREQVESLNVFKTVLFEPEESDRFDMNVFFESVKPELIENIEHNLEDQHAIKWQLIIHLALYRLSPDGDKEIIKPFFNSYTYTQLTNDMLSDNIDEAFSKIIKSFENFIQRGSGWILEEIFHLELKMSKYNPLKGSSFMQLPKRLKGKKSLLNIQNTDSKCLLWCLLAHKLKLTGKDNAERSSKYLPYENELDMTNIQYPTPYHQIPQVEKQNNLRINVYGFEEDEINILYISEREDNDVINLLLISNGENQHYVLIRNFSGFVRQMTKNEHAKHFCFRCLHGFTKEALLKKHVPNCKRHAAQVIKMPAPGENILKFTGIHLQHPVAYCIYADFESLLIPIQSAAPSSTASFIQQTAKHVPCGYAYVIVTSDGKSVKPITVYRGENAVEHFLNAMIKEKDYLGKKLAHIKPMKLTAEEEIAFQTATECSICTEPLFEKRVRDHDHLSGVFRGAAHASCNLNFKQRKMIPVIFHNLKNYDGHHIMSELGKFADHQIDVIAITLEKYISFKLRKFGSSTEMVFLDSFQFLPTSLEKLVNNLDPAQFSILKENFPPSTDLSLFMRKGVYPYDYLSSFEKFQDTKLPPPEAFFNSLTGECIDEVDYNHAQNVWNYFKLETLGQYHDIYVKTDVLLLADVFQNFRKLSMNYYNIDAAHLYTSPGLSWHSCFKMCGVQLELLTDIDMLLFVEKGIRGGVSQISHRMATANNPLVPNYDDKAPNSYIMYWDANNLYGWSMSQYLPYGGFEWVDVKQMSQDFILSISDESDVGYFFEVDLDYPHILHDSHNDYPLAPERVTVTEKMLSPYAKSLLLNKPFKGTPKLIPNLNNKKNYVIHYRNLKLYLQLGLKLIKIHSALRFKQSPWLKTYIDFNTCKRKEATSPFQKEYFKLLNNSMFGKSMENLRKRKQIQLCTKETQGMKLVASPNFHTFKQFDNNLVAVERSKPTIVMNRPIYVGFAILELSKCLMYDFHYNFIKEIYHDKAKLLFTDTDSLTYSIETENIYKDMAKHSDAFDFSDYPPTHFLQSDINKKVIGKFKDELNSEVAYEFVGLKAKMYSLKSGSGEKKRAKGVSTRIIRNTITHEDYVKCLKEEKASFALQTRIDQQSHRLYSINQNKVCLSPFDDKRYLHDNGISSFAYGHYKIKGDESK